jgi:hypothetical protein
MPQFYFATQNLEVYKPEQVRTAGLHSASRQPAA